MTLQQPRGLKSNPCEAINVVVDASSKTRFEVVVSLQQPFETRLEGAVVGDEGDTGYITTWRDAIPSRLIGRTFLGGAFLVVGRTTTRAGHCLWLLNVRPGEASVLIFPKMNVIPHDVSGDVSGAVSDDVA